MKKSQLTKITTILPFDSNYVKVGKNSNKLWNLMDSEGNLISETWFENIENTTDGAIITKEKKNEMRFVNVDTFKKYNNVRDLVPASVIGLLDIDTIKPTECSGYVAKAFFFGKRIYIKADGRIFGINDNELHIMFNCVDTIRLNNAVYSLNKKLQYNGNFSSTEDTGWETIITNKISLFGFYWIDDDECSVHIGRENVKLSNVTKKWTDDFKLRATLNMPKRVREKLTELWGEPETGKVGEFNEHYTWTFTKDKLEFIIDTLNNID